MLVEIPSHAKPAKCSSKGNIMEDIANRRLNRDLIIIQQNAKEELDEKNTTSTIRDVDDPAILPNERSYPLNNDIGISANNAQNSKTYSDVRQL